MSLFPVCEGWARCIAGVTAVSIQIALGKRALRQKEGNESSPYHAKVEEALKRARQGT